MSLPHSGFRLPLSPERSLFLFFPLQPIHSFTPALSSHHAQYHNRRTLSTLPPLPHTRATDPLHSLFTTFLSNRRSDKSTPTPLTDRKSHVFQPSIPPHTGIQDSPPSIPTGSTLHSLECWWVRSRICQPLHKRGLHGQAPRYKVLPPVRFQRRRPMPAPPTHLLPLTAIPLQNTTSVQPTLTKIGTTILIKRSPHLESICPPETPAQARIVS